MPSRRQDRICLGVTDDQTGARLGTDRESNPRRRGQALTDFEGSGSTFER